MKLYIANHLDIDDHSFRIAGIYSTRKAAEQRINRLESGAVQELQLNKTVKLLVRIPSKHGLREPESGR